MNHADTILAEYASADETERLYLFLSHRDFRDHFIKIDMSESSRVPEKRSIQPVIGWIDRFFHFCPGP